MNIKAKITKENYKQLEKEAKENNINIEVMAGRAIKTWLRAMKIKKKMGRDNGTNTSNNPGI